MMNKYPLTKIIITGPQYEKLQIIAKKHNFLTMTETMDYILNEV